METKQINYKKIANQITNNLADFLKNQVERKVKELTFKDIYWKDAFEKSIKNIDRMINDAKTLSDDYNRTGCLPINAAEAEGNLRGLITVQNMLKGWLEDRINKESE